MTSASLPPLLSPDQYYSKLQSGPILEQIYEPGQFFWAPALYLFGQNPVRLVKGKYDGNSQKWQYHIEAIADKEFETPDEPVKPLGISSTERAAIVRCKLRPVILLSKHSDKWKDVKRAYDDAYLIAPVYTFEGDDTKASYSPAFIERVKAYVYNVFFYLPPSVSPHVKESFVRLDRLQVIHRDQLRHKPLALSSDALWLLQSWISYFLGAPLDSVNDVLFDYREMAIGVLREAGMLK